MDFPAMPKFRRPKAVGTIISESIPIICQRTRVGCSALNSNLPQVSREGGSSEVYATKNFPSPTTRMLRGKNFRVNGNSRAQGFLLRQNGKLKRIRGKTTQTQNTT